MVNFCAVYGCNNNSRNENKNLKFFRFPYAKGICKNRIEMTNKRRKLWFNFLKRTDIQFDDLKTRVVCSAHFISGKPANSEDEKNVDWVPSLKAPTKSTRDGTVVARYKRLEIRNDSKAQQQTVCDDFITQQVGDNEKCNCETQTELTYEQMQSETVVRGNEMKALLQEIEQLQKRNNDLLMKEESFVGRNLKLKFYTGLPNLRTVHFVMNSINQGLSQIRVKGIDDFQKLLITLMKLRLNLSYTDLAYRFNISVRTASMVFQKVVIMLKHSLENVIHWPGKECLKESTPLSFRIKFGCSVVVIIDCFEISTQRPSTMRARNQSWSEYKQKYTAKYLIGITTYGAVSFISDGFAGHTTDTVITERSGIINKLTPGDLVLADRGFLVKELVASQEAELKTPAFKNGKAQLHPREVEESREIANVRIHVERVIGNIKQKYNLLNGPVPISLLKTSFQNLTLLDYAVHVACILTNLCNSIVPDV